ncbi:MAG: patatin-like phospholipase family protein [Alphaproteobacteria bacterium]|nr:MAG: patatin-like phospholipase family protein [Alphaproteobacteria bacterium]
MTMPAIPDRPASYDMKVALVLQGGGALGSYQAGVYEALADSPYLPDWVAGISIGGVNAAIIAGNAPENRTAALRDFWETVTAPTAWWPRRPDGPLADAQRKTAALAALLFGQPGFFVPRAPLDWLGTVQPTSYYDTGALKCTLERLVDFDRINDAKDMRLSLGAVNVRTGRFAYFDSAEITIRPEHVMASGALPPGFPPVEIDGEYYWDGGLVSNTPLQYVLDYIPRRSRLIFQVDLFQAHGRIPGNLEEVSERDKDIRYSSRTRVSTEAFKLKHDARHNINELYEMLPDDLKQTAAAKWLYDFSCVTLMDLAQLIYRPGVPQGPCKDYEFSRATMNARWAQGRADAYTTLAASPWLAPREPQEGLRVFDVMHDILVAACDDEGIGDIRRQGSNYP